MAANRLLQADTALALRISHYKQLRTGSIRYI
jgi:hypothetical protein